MNTSQPSSWFESFNRAVDIADQLGDGAFVVHGGRCLGGSDEYGVFLRLETAVRLAEETSRPRGVVEGDLLP